jgi:hypothetical protein
MHYFLVDKSKQSNLEVFNYKKKLMHGHTLNIVMHVHIMFISLYKIDHIYILLRIIYML